MLVDLGRNDLGRVCEPGTVKVHSFFSVERYSHVMHIVSTVTGTAARRPQRLRRGRRLLPGRHPVRRAEAAGDGDHRGAGADPARALRRHRRLPRLRRRRRHRDRHPHRAGPRRGRLRAGRRRDRGRLRAGGRGRRVPEQGARGAVRGGRRGDPGPAGGPAGRRCAGRGPAADRRRSGADRPLGRPAAGRWRPVGVAGRRPSVGRRRVAAGRWLWCRSADCLDPLVRGRPPDASRADRRRRSSSVPGAVALLGAGRRSPPWSPPAARCAG